MKNEILRILEHNSRIDIHELATRLGVDDSIVASEIVKMEEDKIICGYNTLINWDNTSEEKVTALIEVKVMPQRSVGFDSIAERIYNYEEVSAVYLMSGAFDFTVLIEGKSMKEVAKFVFERLATIEFVVSTATHFVLRKYKDHGIVLDDKKKDDRMMVTA